MKKFKKGLSLIAAVAFLITALVPLGAMAAGPASRIESEPGSTTATSNPIPSSTGINGTWIYGTWAGGTKGRQLPVFQLGDAGEGTSTPANLPIVPVYVWAGSTLDYSTNPAGAAQWFVSTTRPTGSLGLSQFTADPTIVLPTAPVLGTTVYVAAKATNGANTAWSVIYEIIPVQLQMAITAPQEVSGSLKAYPLVTWNGVTSATEAGEDTTLPVQVQWGTPNVRFQGQWQITTGAGNIQTDLANATNIPSDATLAWSIAGGTPSIPSSFSAQDGEQTSSIASVWTNPQVAWLDPNESSPAYYTLTLTGGLGTLSGLPVPAVADVSYTGTETTLTEDRFVDITGVPGIGIAGGEEMTPQINTSAVMGDVTTLTAILPQGAYGKWTISGTTGSPSGNGTYFVANNQGAIDNPQNQWQIQVKDNVKVGSVNTSQLSFVSPFYATPGTFKVVFEACVDEGTLISLPGTNLTAGAVITTVNDTNLVPQQLTYQVSPTTDDPAMSSEVVVNPAVNVLARSTTKNPTFEVSLHVPGGLAIQDIKNARYQKADGTWVSLNVVPDSDFGYWNAWVEFGFQGGLQSLPVGDYNIDFDTYVGLPNSAQNTWIKVDSSATLRLVDLQGNVNYATNGWRPGTIYVRAAQNQKLNLSCSWFGADGITKNIPSNAASYLWQVRDANGKAVNQYLTSSPDSLDAVFNVPKYAENSRWTVTCTPMSDAEGKGESVSAALTFDIVQVQANASPSVNGYMYTVTPAESVTAGAAAAAVGTGKQNVPAGGKANAGATVKITANLSLQNDPEAMDYQWMVFGADSRWTELVEGEGISGVNAQTLTVPASAATNGWSFYCKVTNKTNAQLQADNSANYVVLQVATDASPNPNAAPIPLIVSYPATSAAPIANPTNQTTLTVSSGRQVQLDLRDTNSPALPDSWLRVQWMQASTANGPFTAIEGATGLSYAFIASPENSGTVYQCHVTNLMSQGLKTADSNKIIVQTAAPNGSIWFTNPLITPDPINVRVGGTATMSVAAKTDNDDPIGYQWQIARIAQNTQAADVLEGAWTNVAGATSAELTTQPLAAGHYFYRCIATNTAVPSQTATSVLFRVNVNAISNVPVVTPAHKKSGDQVNWIAAGATEGNQITFSVKADVPTDDPLTYTWYMTQPANGQFTDPTSAANAVLLVGNDQGTLTITAPESYNGCSFVCQVTNANSPTVYAYSAVWNLTVWPKDSVPTIQGQPRNITATYPSPYAEEATNEARQTQVVIDVPVPPYTTGTSWGEQVPVLQKLEDGVWTNVSDITKDEVQLQNIIALTAQAPAIANGRATWTAAVELSNDAHLANGQYRFAVIGYRPSDANWTPYQNQYNAASYQQYATTYSEPFAVDITVLGQPVITENPQKQTVEIGQKATFKVAAAVEPSTTELTYRWQISTDDGATWRNCLTADGSGFGTREFTTADATAAMQNQAPILYRCVVQNIATKQSATSEAAELWIGENSDAAQNTIKPAEGSNLTISEVDGVKYLRSEALTATADGTKVSDVLKLVMAPEGYTLQITEADGTVKDDDAVAATGDLLKLISASGETVDQVTIVVRGDVLGSGVMSLTQLVRMAEAFRTADPVPLEGAFFMAGDLTGTGSIDLTDLVQEAETYKTELMAAE